MYPHLRATAYCKVAEVRLNVFQQQAELTDPTINATN